MSNPKQAKVMAKKEDGFQQTPETETKKLFKVNKIFAQWVVSLDIEEGDNYDSLLQKAMKTINDMRIIPTHPEHDHVLEEVN